MGWIGTPIMHWKTTKHGKQVCDRNAHVRELFRDSQYEIIDSAMNGSEWYGALRRKAETPMEELNQTVTGLVVLTRIKDGYIYTKEIMESMGPSATRCPKHVLDALSPTDSEWANEWREKCCQWRRKKHDPDSLGNLPVGTVIQMKDQNGWPYRLEKMPPGYQFKRPFWIDTDQGGYVPKTWIPNDYEVVYRPESED